MKIQLHPARTTYSICPICRRRLPARLVLEDGAWYMKKSCPEHGGFRTVVWRDRPGLQLPGWGNYRPPREAEPPNCPADCGLCARHLQKTCCVLVELTRRCNLHCAFCFAEGGEAETEPERTPAQWYDVFRELVESGRGFIQLSGGEPTVRDDLPEIVAAARRAGASSIQLNSNGLRLAREPAFAAKLAEAGLDFVFLQFDGLDDAVYQKLRGQPLLEEKLAAIDVCDRLHLGVTLVPTLVPGVNTDQIGAIVRFGMKRSPAVRGVHFQPVSYFGRVPNPPEDGARITLPEVIEAIERQTGGLVRIGDIAPSACDHPRCGFHGDFVVLPDRLLALTPKPQAGDCCCGHGDADDAALKNRSFVARRWKRSADAEAQADPAADLSDFDGFLSRVRSHGFTITGMAFQDAYNLDMERLRRCSLHVWSEGRIVPFCAHYL